MNPSTKNAEHIGKPRVLNRIVCKYKGLSPAESFQYANLNPTHGRFVSCPDLPLSGPPCLSEEKTSPKIYVLDKTTTPKLLLGNPLIRVPEQLITFDCNTRDLIHEVSSKPILPNRVSSKPSIKNQVSSTIDETYEPSLSAVTQISNDEAFIKNTIEESKMNKECLKPVTYENKSLCPSDEESFMTNSSALSTKACSSLDVMNTESSTRDPTHVTSSNLSSSKSIDFMNDKSSKSYRDLNKSKSNQQCPSKELIHKSILLSNHQQIKHKSKNTQCTKSNVSHSLSKLPESILSHLKQSKIKSYRPKYKTESLASRIRCQPTCKVQKP